MAKPVPKECLAMAIDRWTPLYLEHGRLEVNDSSVSWIGADGVGFNIPVATMSTIMLGPGTTTTHAAIRACAESGCPVCWVGENGFRFYAYGLAGPSTNKLAEQQVTAWACRNKKAEVVRRMFAIRFNEEIEVGRSIAEMRGMEGIRMRKLYTALGEKHGVTWKGRNYSTSNWDLSDDINKAISAANHYLYALSTSVIVSLGLLPQLGFLHDNGDTPLTYDIADLYKHNVTLPIAFETIASSGHIDDELIRIRLKERIEKLEIVDNMVTVLKALFT